MTVVDSRKQPVGVPSASIKKAQNALYLAAQMEHPLQQKYLCQPN